MMNTRMISVLVLGVFSTFAVYAAPTHLVDEAPTSIIVVDDGIYLVDFGRVAFGNIRLSPPSGAGGSVTFHFGEGMINGRINRQPPGSVRYKVATAILNGGNPVIVAPAKDARNTRINHPNNPPAILTPPEWGVILPFRWLEIEGWNGKLLPEHLVRQSAFASAWDDGVASFECSDEVLNRIWELCHYSIKATTFAGVYVDGDRERIPYEADAYLNQLSHYFTNHDIQMARDTFDHLLTHPTWPTEWAPHMVFMIHADWMHTGDKQWVADHYEQLKSKILSDRKGADGLIASNPQHIKRIDIVDWPKGERDNYVFTSRNTVVNAFHLRAIKLMSEMARALAKDDESELFESNFKKTYSKFQEAFFDVEKGLYRDGIETHHHSLHANLFPLAFGLVPEEACEDIAEWLAKRGMKCSVYAAQYLMEGLFENGAAQQAVALMTAENDRSWRHMVENGATITWEAWDQKYKPNLDWNHAWGAAPANLLPRYILGAEPLMPGWETVRIRPLVAGLSQAKGEIPTLRGNIRISWKCLQSFKLTLSLPEGMKACVELPMIGTSSAVFREGKRIDAMRSGNRWILDCNGSETITLEVKEARQRRQL